MNLSQLASFICTKVNQSETDDVAACKEFLKRRMEMIWNDDLWKDSLVAFTQVLSPDDYAVTSTWLPEKGVLLCPTIIERVVAARLDSRKLNVQRQEFYYRFDYDSFAKTGSATEFVLLPPCVWEFEESDVVIFVAAGADSMISATADILASNLADVTRETLTLEDSLTSTERVDSFTKPTTSDAVILGKGVGITCVNNSSGPVTFSSATGSVVVAAGQTGLCPATSNDTLIDANYGAESDNGGGLGVEPFGTATTSGFGTLFYDDAEYGSQSYLSIATIAASDLSAPLRQRIRLLNIPEAEVTIRVLGKRKMPTFTSDLDSPPISGVTNCLLAFAQSDMLQRERQYGKSQAIAQEGMGLLEQLKRQEVVQQAHNIRIQPDTGMGGEYDFNSGGYSPLTF